MSCVFCVDMFISFVFIKFCLLLFCSKIVYILKAQHESILIYFALMFNTDNFLFYNTCITWEKNLSQFKKRPMKLWKYIFFPGTITASKAYRVMTNSGNQPSRSLLCDIMMYKNKDSSTISAIQWGLKHELYW
jgi:hypothetical protein